MSQKKLPKPAWYKNTYFWIAGVLLLVALIGLPFVKGDAAIRDPGQKRETNLYIIYFVATAVMVGNGVMSHRQTVQQFEEQQEQGGEEEKK